MPAVDDDVARVFASEFDESARRHSGCPFVAAPFVTTAGKGEGAASLAVAPPPLPRWKYREARIRSALFVALSSALGGGGRWGRGRAPSGGGPEYPAAERTDVMAPWGVARPLLPAPDRSCCGRPERDSSSSSPSPSWAWSLPSSPSSSWSGGAGVVIFVSCIAHRTSNRGTIERRSSPSPCVVLLRLRGWRWRCAGALGEMVEGGPGRWGWEGAGGGGSGGILLGLGVVVGGGSGIVINNANKTNARCGRAGWREVKYSIPKKIETYFAPFFRERRTYVLVVCRFEFHGKKAVVPTLLTSLSCETEKRMSPYCSYTYLTVVIFSLIPNFFSK